MLTVVIVLFVSFICVEAALFRESTASPFIKGRDYKSCPKNCLPLSNLASVLLLVGHSLCSRNSKKKSLSKTKHKGLFVGAWNVRTLQDNENNPERRTAVISKLLDAYKLDIVALSETRLADSGQLSEKEYTFFWSGRPEEEQRYSGVGFAICNTLAKKLEVLPEAISDRLMTLRLPIGKKKTLLCISVYAPTMLNSYETKEKFYEDLRNVLLKTSSGDSILLLGDFNARVGNQHDAWPDVLGKHLLGNVNSNGLHLLSLCSEFQLVITNSVFQQPNKYKGTWRHPRSKDWHTMDYIITRQSEINNVKSTRARRGTECWSDHRLVTSELKLNVQKIPRRTETKMPKKINCSSLINPSSASAFAKELDTQVKECNIDEDIETSWKSLKEAIYNTSVDLLGFPNRKHQDWFDEKHEEASKLIDTMHRTHLLYMNNKKSKKAKNKYFETKRKTQNAYAK